MLKKRIARLTAVIIAAIMLIEMMPAEGVKAATQIAQKVFSTIVEPTMVYRGVYGFINGVARVEDKDGKVGLIDTSGKEIIPCGKYKNISGYFMKSDVLVVTDSNNHAYVIDYSGNVKLDLGTCVNAYLTTEANQQNVRENIICVETETSYRYLKMDGSLIREGAKTTSNQNDNPYKILTDSGKYSKVSELSSANNTSVAYYLCEIEKDNGVKTYVVIDSQMKEHVTLDNAVSYSNLGNGFLKVVCRIENEVDGEIEYVNSTSIMTYDGKVIVGGDNNFVSTVNNYINGSIFVYFPSDELWKEYDISGNVLVEYAGYAGIETVYMKDIVLGYKNVYNANSEIIRRHYYILNNNDKSVIDIGESVSVEKEYLENNKIVFKTNVLSRDDYGKPGYKLVDTKGNVVLDTSKYAGIYSNVRVSDKYIYAYTVIKDAEGKDKGKSKYVVYNMDGTEFFDGGACDDIYISSSKINVYRPGNTKEVYDMNRNLICVYDYNQYEYYGYDYDGYMPVQNKEGKWGIVRLIDNPALVKPVTDVNKQENISTTTVNDNDNVKAPSKVKIGKLVAGKKKVTVNLPKLKNGVKGYKIQYSLKKNFKKAGSVTSKKAKVVLKKLKTGKTYYIRVKAYKLNGRKKVFSKKWSAVKKVKVK